MAQPIPRSFGWLAYRVLLVFLILISLIGSIRGRSGDLLMLFVVANGALALHGCLTQQGYFRPGLWRWLYWLDALALLGYALLLVIDFSGPERWALPLMVGLLYYPMLHALRIYAWHSPQHWT